MQTARSSRRTWEMGRTGPPVRKEQIECQFTFKTVATKSTSDPDGGGQLWQKRRERQERHEKERWRHERQERRSASEPEPESKESVWRRWNSKHRRQGETDEPHRQRSRHIGTWRKRCSGGTTAAASSFEFSRLGVD